MSDKGILIVGPTELYSEHLSGCVEKKCFVEIHESIIQLLVSVRGVKKLRQKAHQKYSVYLGYKAKDLLHPLKMAKNPCLIKVFNQLKANQEEIIYTECLRKNVVHKIEEYDVIKKLPQMKWKLRCLEILAKDKGVNAMMNDPTLFLTATANISGREILKLRDLTCKIECLQTGIDISEWILQLKREAPGTIEDVLQAIRNNKMYLINLMLETCMYIMGISKVITDEMIDLFSSETPELCSLRKRVKASTSFKSTLSMLEEEENSLLEKCLDLVLEIVENIVAKEDDDIRLKMKQLYSLGKPDFFEPDFNSG